MGLSGFGAPNVECHTEHFYSAGALDLYVEWGPSSSVDEEGFPLWWGESRRPPKAARRSLLTEISMSKQRAKAEMMSACREQKAGEGARRGERVIGITHIPDGIGGPVRSRGEKNRPRRGGGVGLAVQFGES